MPRDERYNQLKRSILNHRIETFNQIFDLIPKTVVAKDLHISIDAKLNNIEILTLAAAQHEANEKPK